MKITYLFLVVLIFFSCNVKNENHREYINLDGKWQFALDTANIGMEQKWYLTDLNDSVFLPGTTDSNKKGFLNTDTTTLHLHRVYKYEGVAWYRKQVVIPQNFSQKHIQLFLERTKASKIWIDSTLVGESALLQTPHKFDVSAFLPVGKHFITIRIDNNLKQTPYGNVHIYSDDTQTNWNGIIGKMFLEATAQTYITNIKVYPNIETRKVNIKIGIENRLHIDNVDVELLIEKTLNGKTTQLKSQKTTTLCKNELMLEYNLGEQCSLWDEYEQPVYQLTVVISNKEIKDSKKVIFGMRSFKVNNTQFSINGRTVFLRGKHEAAVFPLTGYPPMDVEEWQRVYKIAKSYGINHYRFHSYCPPEAAFIAANLEGMYIQAEVPFWGGLDSDSVAQMLQDEGFAMIDEYANHPSFVLFSHGNEIWSGHSRVEKNITAFKNYDNRILYTTGSNNGIGYIPPPACADFFVAVRTPYAHDTTLTHTRLTHAFVDTHDGGILNTQIPSTNFNFNYAVSQLKIPIVSHEIGQYQIFPNYNEMDKYTGVLRAENLRIFKNRLMQSGMGSMDSAFQKASGAWSAICYKAEMEAALRTSGFAGFQLLDLQDFPGQGTALVGILDAFMDSKNVVTQHEWTQSCNDAVILLEFQKYCFTSTEPYWAKVNVANYSNKNIRSTLNWEIKHQNGATLKKGSFADLTIKNGGITTVGEISVDLSAINNAEKLRIELSIAETSYTNSYPFWVYPPAKPIEIPADILVSEEMSEKVFNHLQAGGKVLLFPKTEDVKNNSVAGLFPPDFWNYGMFKGISEWAKKPLSPGTLGILTQPNHAIFNSFPTDYHTNWQWFSIIKASNPLILDNTAANYLPVVQVIDNLERNHKLGLVFEFKVGKGKLLVCMSQLPTIATQPEAAQFYQSIVNYTISNNFNPSYEIDKAGLDKLFGI